MVFRGEDRISAGVNIYSFLVQVKYVEIITTKIEKENKLDVFV